MKDMTLWAHTGNRNMESLPKDMSNEWLDRQKERHRWEWSKGQRQKKGFKQDKKQCRGQRRWRCIWEVSDFAKMSLKILAKAVSLECKGEIEYK